MFDFLKTIRDRSDAKRAAVKSDAERYIEMIHRGVNGPALTRSERDELADIAERLNYTPAQVEQDAQTVVDYQRAKELGDTFDARRLAHKQANADHAAFIADEEIRVRERDARLKAINLKISEAARDMQAAGTAKEKTDALARHHWKLLNLPNPTPASAAPALHDEPAARTVIYQG
ncbi:MAG: hypothetical protein QM754_10715 [Tepidisphaeraceae bacterium]